MGQPIPEPHPDLAELEAAMGPMLRAELSRDGELAITISSEIDRTILTEAKAGYARRSRFRRAVGWSGAGAAAAAAMVLLVLHFAGRSPSGPMQPGMQVAVGDVDRDGKVDILDAYIVAQSLSRHGRPEAAWDVNGDGVVDQKDVDWIANAAVRLGPGDL